MSHLNLKGCAITVVVVVIILWIFGPTLGGRIIGSILLGSGIFALVKWIIGKIKKI